MTRLRESILAVLAAVGFSACLVDAADMAGDGTAFDEVVTADATPATLARATAEPEALGGEPQTAPRPTLTVDDLAVTGLVNDRATTDAPRLVEQCGLRSFAAERLIARRDGPDGTGGTDDDEPFRSIRDVEAVSGVGEWSVDRLLECADALGYAPTYGEAAVLLLLNDSPRTDLHRLDRTCGIRLDSARNLIVHRDGADGRSATPDDDRFDSIAEVDAVPRVGPRALGRLATCARRLDYATIDAIATPLASLVEHARAAE
jgi:hypothetical protein